MTKVTWDKLNGRPLCAELFLLDRFWYTHKKSELPVTA